jgi:6-phosphofructokinase
MAKDVLTKVEGSKVWTYVAMAGGIAALAGVAFIVKEMIDAKRVAKVKEDVKEELKEVAAENGVVLEEGAAEETSGCGGCSSGVIGRSFPQKASYETESFSGARGGKDIFAKPSFKTGWTF